MFDCSNFEKRCGKNEENKQTTPPPQPPSFRFVWPWAKKSSVCHDSYHCRAFARTRPFPTRREEGAENNFVASVFNNRPVLDRECPEKCRPRDHREEWTRC